MVEERPILKVLQKRQHRTMNIFSRYVDMKVVYTLSITRQAVGLPATFHAVGGGHFFDPPLRFPIYLRNDWVYRNKI